MFAGISLVILLMTFFTARKYMHTHGIAELRVSSFYFEEGDTVTLNWFGEITRFIHPSASFYDGEGRCLIADVPLNTKEFNCTPSYGRYSLETIVFTFGGLFKLWSIKVENQIDCSFVVRFPERTEMSAHTDRSTEQQSVSKGISKRDELYDHRLYQPGDDTRFINWNLYARFNELYVKSPELTPPTRAHITICVIIDDDPALGNLERLILSYAASLGKFCFAEACDVELAVRSGYEWIITKPESYEAYRSSLAAAARSKGELHYTAAGGLLVVSAAHRLHYFSQIRAARREFIIPDVQITKKMSVYNRIQNLFLEERYVEHPDDEKNNAFLRNKKRLVQTGGLK